VTREKIEQMILELLPLVDGKPDMDGDRGDIAYIVLLPSGSEELQPFFVNRTGEEGWREIARVLASALITMDKTHREIIREIRSTEKSGPR